MDRVTLDNTKTPRDAGIFAIFGTNLQQNNRNLHLNGHVAMKMIKIEFSDALLGQPQC